MNNEETAKMYLVWVGNNYTQLQERMKKYCASQHLEYDEDIFSDTYLKIYEKIRKNGLKDTSEEGMLNYTFIAFKINTLREPMYARNKKRNLNITDDAGLNALYEDFLEGEITQREKLVADLFKDFAVIYILHQVEEHFDPEHFKLFQMKFLGDMTFKELRRKSGVKGARDKVKEVMEWLKVNVTKDEVREAFFEIFQNVIC